MFKNWAGFLAREDLDKQQVIIMVKNNLAAAAAEKRKYKHHMPIKTVEYRVGGLLLLTNHRLRSGIKGEIKKFFLLHSEPYKVKERKMQNALEKLETGE